MEVIVKNKIVVARESGVIVSYVRSTYSRKFIGSLHDFSENVREELPNIEVRGSRYFLEGREFGFRTLEIAANHVYLVHQSDKAFGTIRLAS